MDQRQWRWEFEQVEQRIQHNLDKLRELNEQMADAIKDAELRRQAPTEDSPQR